MRVLGSLTALSLVVACTPPLDDGDGRDAGAADARDAGELRDAGIEDFPDVIAGETFDAGADAGVDAGDESVDAGPSGPNVDRTDPRLIALEFTPDDIDASATLHLGLELVHLDTRVEPVGLLVVYLHGAGAPNVCGSRDHGEMLAARGFHVVAPCYVSDYGVGNCGDDIEGCRLEAFEGVDHHPFIDIAPADSIELRVVRMLEHLAENEPAGDWGFFIDDATGAPLWERIVISGISHGASSSGVIGIHREVARVVMLSGPLDSNQAWLSSTPLTPRERFFAFTHENDEQHAGHLAAFDTMQLPGTPVDVDVVAPPYEASHRLVTNAETTNGHGSTQAGSTSPRDGDGAFVFLPVWAALYGP